MNKPSAADHSRIIRNISREIGFDFCGFSEVAALKDVLSGLENWLARGYHGKMDYMARNRELRTDPGLLVPGARSVISLLYNYYPARDLSREGEYKVAKYAYGEDYHKVLRKKLKLLMHRIRDEVGEIDGRVFVDSAPVMERQWAARAGLGWIGKNTLLLNRRLGSYFFIAELIVDIELEYDGPVKDYCGTCRRCLDACPTGAFPQPGVLDASRCISYFTIELREHIPPGLHEQFQNWIFGCDICQDVCPWNRFAKPHNEPDFDPSETLVGMRTSDWERLDEEEFLRIFENSALRRAGIAGLRRNITYVKKGPPAAGPEWIQT
jgi:epoxyqueuosine reductase